MKIGIVGLGLIGGSLGLDWSVKHEVVGISRRPQTAHAALDRGVVQQAGTDLALLRGVQVVVVCTPIATIPTIVKELAPFLPEAAVVTDVGSVKGPIVAAARLHWPRFIGGHPMAGKAEAGLEAAESQLFAQRPYVLTPVADTDPEAEDALATLIEDLGADLHRVSPDVHDRAVAWISHLPVMVSSSLIQACEQEADRSIFTLAAALASSGFRDTSRVGGGVPELGVMMARYNREALLRSLKAYEQTLAEVTTLIHQEDWTALEQHLRQAQAARPQFL